MTSASEVKTQQFRFAFQPSLPDLQKYLLALPRLQAVGIRAALNQQREMLAFLKRRCDQDLQLAERIANAGEVKDVYDAMISFYKDVAEQYTAEAGKVAELGSRAASDAIRSVRHEAETLKEQEVGQKVP